MFELEEIDGKAALFFAAKNDFSGVVNRLESNGLYLNITDDEGKTAVFYANQHHNLFALCDLIWEFLCQIFNFFKNFTAFCFFCCVCMSANQCICIHYYDD